MLTEQEIAELVDGGLMFAPELGGPPSAGVPTERRPTPVPPAALRSGPRRSIVEEMVAEEPTRRMAHPLLGAADPRLLMPSLDEVSSPRVSVRPEAALVPSQRPTRKVDEEDPMLPDGIKPVPWRMLLWLGGVALAAVLVGMGAQALLSGHAGPPARLANVGLATPR